MWATNVSVPPIADGQAWLHDRCMKVRLLLMASLLAVGASARAEPETDAKHAIQAMYSYGGCVVDFSPSRTRRVLSMVPGSKEEQALLRSVTDDRCINGHGGSQYLFF